MSLHLSFAAFIMAIRGKLDLSDGFVIICVSNEKAQYSRRTGLLSEASHTSERNEIPAGYVAL